MKIRRYFVKPVLDLLGRLHVFDTAQPSEEPKAVEQPSPPTPPGGEPAPDGDFGEVKPDGG